MKLPLELAPHESLCEVLRPHWMIASRSHDLRHRPYPVTLAGQPMVMFRGPTGQVSALLDRCPHRGLPLSKGHLGPQGLSCPYHGWTFDAHGRCQDIPGLETNIPHFKVTSFPVTESQGYVWVWPFQKDAPDQTPFNFGDVASTLAPLGPNVSPAKGPSRRLWTIFQALPASPFSVIENQLDVTHTSVLHRGMFRSASGPSSMLTFTKQRTPKGIAVHYHAGTQVSGLLGRLFGVTPQTPLIHIDAVLSPLITQVFYAFGPYYLAIQSALTSCKSSSTHVWTEVHGHLPLRIRILRPLILPLIRHILSQDRRILQAQSDQAQRFSSLGYVRGPLDVLRPELDELMFQSL